MFDVCQFCHHWSLFQFQSIEYISFYVWSDTEPGIVRQFKAYGLMVRTLFWKCSFRLFRASGKLIQSITFCMWNDEFSKWGSHLFHGDNHDNPMIQACLFKTSPLTGKNCWREVAVFACLPCSSHFDAEKWREFYEFDGFPDAFSILLKRSQLHQLPAPTVLQLQVAVAPVPGSSEMWLATTTMMWLDKDQAWCGAWSWLLHIFEHSYLVEIIWRLHDSMRLRLNPDSSMSVSFKIFLRFNVASRAVNTAVSRFRQHVVYEHPRDADTDTILDQFQCRSSKVQYLTRCS